MYLALRVFSGVLKSLKATRFFCVCTAATATRIPVAVRFLQPSGLQPGGTHVMQEVISGLVFPETAVFHSTLVPIHPFPTREGEEATVADVIHCEADF